MRKGVQFATKHTHERFHTDPLQALLADAAPGKRPAVVVHADTRPPTAGAWNVQIFHGLGDKNYTGNPLYLQRGRYPRVRTAANMAAKKLGGKTSYLEPPAKPGRRRSRYQQVNAYGPRFRDRLEAMLSDATISLHGHVALNASNGIRYDPKGPVLWLPTWDNRAFMGGPRQSSLKPFADDVLRLSQLHEIRVKFHPHTILYNQDAGARSSLELSSHVHVVPSETSPYAAMQGVSAVLTDTSSLAFEAACSGIPVMILKAEPWHLGGLHDELDDFVPVFGPGEAIADGFRLNMNPPRAWCEDLLLRPAKAHNAAFAQELRERAHG